MSTPTDSVTQVGPAVGMGSAARWSFSYALPDEWGGGFSCGELLLRSDGTLLRRYGGSSQVGHALRWDYGPWEPVPAWGGERNAKRAAAVLRSRGYTLREPGPVAVWQSSHGPVPGNPLLATGRPSLHRIWRLGFPRRS